jgi:hypothetical protein
MKKDRFSRRTFLQLSALTLGGAGLRNRASAEVLSGDVVPIVVSPGDRLASAPHVQWAIRELQQAITLRGLGAPVVESLERAPAANVCIVAAGGSTALAQQATAAAGMQSPVAPESVAIAAATQGGRRVVLASGGDARGLMYAVLELADGVEYADDVIRELREARSSAERPFNAVRAIGRPFVSNVEDTWFTDRAFWPDYFAMLARQRFNRFHLALGFGYDTLRWVTDAYLLFPYPFLVDVPGHRVRAVNLPDAERDRNLELLRFISREAVAHGLDFQLGIWTHGYTWADSPTASYTIDGLSPGNHAAYCRDALAAVLQACPDITGVTLRTHYESGVREGSYAFWKTIFEGVPRSGRRLEIELHAKGLDRRMIDAAMSAGMPIRLSAKYWAEHMGLPYHQTAIRELELPHTDPGLDPFSALSLGSRNHTRYGYADFMEEQRPWGLMFRVFPGTHKFLLWGDPVTAAAHARAFRFCRSDGAELLEPLAFKGRRGSGVAGSRCAYAKPALNPRRDWEKFLYTYVVWGRLLYSPDCDPTVWRRVLRAQFGGGAGHVEAALGAATRILPIVSTAHTPSAAQDTYSPEFYTNQSTVDPPVPAPYGDTPEPKVFGNVSPLDPELFSSIRECAASLLARNGSGKYSPIEVAGWIEDLAASSTESLAEAVRTSPAARNAELERAAIDIRLQVGIGRFFAAKFRSAGLYAIFEASASRLALEEALKLYRQARDHWSRLADGDGRAYVADVTFGPLPHQRGHWLDRLPAIDADIAAMERRLALAPARTPDPPAVRAAIDEMLGRPQRPSPGCRHVLPAGFTPGVDLDLRLTVTTPPSPLAVRLHYRHVNQAERYQVAEMLRQGGIWRAAIPAAYTDSPFPLQYYFELREGSGKAALYPGFTPDLTNVPYFVVRQQLSGSAAREATSPRG